MTRDKYPDRIPVRYVQHFSHALFMHVCLIADFVINVFQVIVEKAGRTDVPEIDEK